MNDAFPTIVILLSDCRCKLGPYIVCFWKLMEDMMYCNYRSF